MNKEVFIKVRGLHQRFGENHVLRGVDMEVYKGETLVLLGGSGGGKSVLVKHFLGLLQPLEGTVEVEGEDISTLNEREIGPVRRKIGMMFQNGALFDSMTVGENVAFSLRQAGEKDEAKVKQRVQDVLDIVRLPNEAEKMPADLSGGMRKRVALARAIIDHPACVLYDEPHAGLDPITADSIDRLMKHLQRDYEVTNVIITHEMRSVFRIADRAIFLKQGQIYWQGTPEELKRSQDPKLKHFIEGNSRPDEGWS